MSFKTNDFIKSVSVLLTGTFLAQLISILASPIISRIYGPEENAYLGLFLKITTLVATIASARLEFVLPIEKRDHHAFGIYQFSLFLSLLISAICFALILIFSLFFNANLSSNDFWFLFSIPIGIAVVSFFNLGNNWELRFENYKGISKASIFLALFSNGFKFLGGLLNGHFLTLIAATIIGYSLASLGFLKRFISLYKGRVLSRKSKRTKALVKQNQDFYTYNLFHVLIDLSRDMIIAAFIWIYFDKIDFGSYEFSYRILKLPVVFMGVALSQVFFRKAKNLIYDRKALLLMTTKTVTFSVLAGLLPFGVLFFYGKEIFVFVFSDDWLKAGEIAEYLSPWLFLNFIYAPISYIPILLNKQKSYFWINFSALIVLISSLLLSFVMKVDFWSGMVLITILQGGLIFVLLCWLLYQIGKIKDKVID